MKKAEKLHKAIEAYLEEIRNEDKRMCEELELTFKDPLADVKVVSGEEVKKYYETSGGRFPTTLLSFDGAGYDYFSYEAEYPTFADKHREALNRVVEALGFEMEMINSYSLGFWPA